jgi:hypothetical protein
MIMIRKLNKSSTDLLKKLKDRVIIVITCVFGLLNNYNANQIIPTTARIQKNKRVYLSNFQQPYPNIIKKLIRPLIAIYGWLAAYIKTEVLLLVLASARTLKE